jgi:hypothetical protein
MLHEREGDAAFICLHTSLSEMVKGISQFDTFSQTYKQQTYSITKVGPKLKKSGFLWAAICVSFRYIQPMYLIEMFFAVLGFSPRSRLS